MAREPLKPQRPPPPLLCNWQPQPLPGGETLLPGVTRTSLRLRLLLQPLASAAAPSVRWIPEQPSGFQRSSPGRRKRIESRPERRGLVRPRDNGTEAAERCLGSRAGPWSAGAAALLGSAQPPPARQATRLRGARLRIGRAGGRGTGGGGEEPVAGGGGGRAGLLPPTRATGAAAAGAAPRGA